MSQARRHQLNVAGPFYVVGGQCMACGAPEHEARDLMSNHDGHCYFQRQPSTPEETNRAIRALFVSCCGAVRYGGQDPEVLRRLAELGEAERCDHPLPGSHVVVRRSLVTFQFQGPEEADAAAEEILDAIRAGLGRGGERACFEPRLRAGDAHVVYWSWYEGVPGIEIRLEPASGEPGRWILRLTRQGRPAMCMVIGDVLQAEPRVSSVRWYTVEDWAQGGERWTELPY